MSSSSRKSSALASDHRAVEPSAGRKRPGSPIKHDRQKKKTQPPQLSQSDQDFDFFMLSGHVDPTPPAAATEPINPSPGSAPTPAPQHITDEMKSDNDGHVDPTPPAPATESINPTPGSAPTPAPQLITDEMKSDTGESLAWEELVERIAALNSSKKEEIAWYDVGKWMVEYYKGTFYCQTKLVKSARATIWWTFRGHFWVGNEINPFQSWVAEDIREDIRKKYENVLNIKRFLKLLVGARKEIATAAAEIVKQEDPAKIEQEFNGFWEKLDMSRSFLGLQNGVLDRNTMVLRAGERSDYLSEYLPFNYEMLDINSAAFKILSSFFDRVFPDPLVRDYVLTQTAAAFDPKFAPETVFIYYGDGANGKSRIAGLNRATFGMLGMSAETDQFMTPKKNNNETRFLAKKCRLVDMQEANLGDRWLMGELKKWTSDKFRDSMKYGHEEEGKITALVNVSLNHYPILVEQDFGTWRRITVIDMPSTFVENPDSLEYKGKQHVYELDEKFKSDTFINTLRGQYMAILLDRYAKHKGSAEVMPPIPRPPAVEASTEAFEDRCNGYKLFELECLEKGEEYRSHEADLWDALQKWKKTRLTGEDWKRYAVVRKDMRAYLCTLQGVKYVDNVRITGHREGNPYQGFMGIRLHAEGARFL
ncbi:hypothetical protein HDV00_008978 [Rhizophlyctis rosea]|nr:hypothetical protein HDV00_008978 [Rhizophlyctis rosea]